MTRRKGAHNRGNTVITPSHPECRACGELKHRLSSQIVENGRWRLLVLDLKAALSRAGGSLGSEPYHPTGDSEHICSCHGADAGPLPRAADFEEGSDNEL